jgi:uncharacterized membrane protein
VQVLVVGFEKPTFSGEVLAELTRLREAGIVRLVDLLVVERAEDGTIHTVDPPGLDGDFGHLATSVLGGSDSEANANVEDGTAWSLDDVVPPGSVAAVALIEHVWAEPLNAAIRRAGGTPLDETWLPADELDALELSG